MDRRSIVLKSISCRGVKSFNLFHKPSIFSVIFIAARNNGRNQQKQKTSADHEGGYNPEWDQTIQFDLNESEFRDLFLEFAIMAQGNLLLFGDKLIGKSRVPITDLCSGHTSDAARHVSYQVRSPEGKPNGVLSFSYSLILPPEAENRIPSPLDLGIPSAPAAEDCKPPPAPPRKSIYPPLSFPESEREDCFCCYDQPPPPDPPRYYPPAAAVGYYPAFDYAVPSPVLSRDAYFSAPAFANGGCYDPPAAALPPPILAVGAYYPSSAPGYFYPPPQDSCGYCNCE